jgi:hypothetical protein
LLIPFPMFSFFTHFFPILLYFCLLSSICFQLWLQIYMSTTTMLVETTLDSTRITNGFLQTFFFPLRILSYKEWYSLFGCCNHHCCV